MKLSILTQTLISRYKDEIFNDNNDYWKRVRALGLESFDLELDVEYDSLAKKNGLFKMNIVFDNTSKFLFDFLQVNYGISFIEYECDYAFVEEFINLLQVSRDIRTYDYSCKVTQISSMQIDAEKVLNKNVYFDLKDKSKVTEIRSLNHLYLLDIQVLNMKKKIPNLIENNIKYHTISDSLPFIFELPLRSLNKELLTYLYDNLHLICSNELIDIFMNLNALDFNMIDEDYFYRDVESVFKYSLNNYKYHRFRIYLSYENQRENTYLQSLVSTLENKFEVVELIDNI